MQGLNEPNFFLMNSMDEAVGKDEGYINPFLGLLSIHSF
jgi:hypothetical protein